MMYPFTVKGNYTSPRGQFSPEETKQNRQYPTQLVEDIQVLCKDGKSVIPKVLQLRAVSWYYHYLQHPGQTRLEETLLTVMYQAGKIHTIRSHVKATVVLVTFTKRHKHKYGNLPTQLVITNPWETLCVDL